MNLLVSLPKTKPEKRAVAVAIAYSFLLVLPSCAMPKLRHPDPAPCLPETFNGATSPESSAQVKIEDFFDDPTLVGLIYQSLAGNQELRILAEEVQIASNEVLARRGAYLPFLTIGGGAALNKFSNFTIEGAGIKNDPFRPGQFLPNPLPNFLLGTNLFWQLDIWRQLRNARDAAVLRYFSTGEGRNYLVTRLVAEIAENYYGLMVLDKRLENLNRIIALQERSYEIAKARKEAARGTDLPVQRFLAEVRKNQSQKLIVNQDIIQAENRINFLLGRFPQPVARMSGESLEDFIGLNLHALSLGVPAQLLQNRPDIRQAERALAAVGLDVKVARANFFPMATIRSGVGYQAFNTKYLLITPEALIYNVAGDLIAPLVNKKAIQAEYMSANARQLQAVYNYQRVIINAVTEVINRMAKVENYGKSIEIKKQQVQSLEAAVGAATSLYQLPRAELPIDYLDVLTAQNELFDAIKDLIDTKGEQLSAIVNTYQALGGGAYLLPIPKPATMKYEHKWLHLILGDMHPPQGPITPGAEVRAHSSAIGAPNRGLVPPPQSPAAPERGLAPPPPPPAAGDRGLVPPPTPPGAERVPEPLPTPAGAAEMVPEPLPDEGSGEGSETPP
jgi:NodT family efflux transporter outer membrane factor (OMF) lipoprotein